MAHRSCAAGRPAHLFSSIAPPRRPPPLAKPEVASPQILNCPWPETLPYHPMTMFDSIALRAWSKSVPVCCM